MSENFIKHLENASKVVRSWPKWKQEVLGGTAVQETPKTINSEIELWGYQCSWCGIKSGKTYRGSHDSASENAPTCCDSEPMIPVKIQSSENLTREKS